MDGGRDAEGREWRTTPPLSPSAAALSGAKDEPNVHPSVSHPLPSPNRPQHRQFVAPPTRDDDGRTDGQQRVPLPPPPLHLHFVRLGKCVRGQGEGEAENGMNERMDGMRVRRRRGMDGGGADGPPGDGNGQHGDSYEAKTPNEPFCRWQGEDGGRVCSCWSPGAICRRRQMFQKCVWGGQRKCKGKQRTNGWTFFNKRLG
ncbi:hypothetical protein niasHT_027629 [Heterodera trifolii]|uniref:Uncharacterized protein n=1 Tax=Heterodera trifolii TaxID=157864 RepID=A0ABD2K5C1_9BILA